MHFENFNQLKLEISNMKALPYFDVNAETTLQTDTSKKGLGAWIIQNISCMEGIHIGNQPEATFEYLQETYD